jgi:hypothetical protein
VSLIGEQVPVLPKKQAKTDPGIAAEQYHFKLILLQIRIEIYNIRSYPGKKIQHADINEFFLFCMLAFTFTLRGFKPTIQQHIYKR